MPDHANGPHVQIEPWTGADLDLLRRVNAPEMKSTWAARRPTNKPPFQGQGIAAAAATAAVARIRAEGKHRYLHAFPSVDNPASNAVCRKAGFSLIGVCDFEYPPGSLMRSNDWYVDLTTISQSDSASG